MKLFLSCPVLLDFSILFQICCPGVQNIFLNSFFNWIKNIRSIGEVLLVDFDSGEIWCCVNKESIKIFAILYSFLNNRSFSLSVIQSFDLTLFKKSGLTVPPNFLLSLRFLISRLLSFSFTENTYANVYLFVVSQSSFCCYLFKNFITEFCSSDRCFAKLFA